MVAPSFGGLPVGSTRADKRRRRLDYDNHTDRQNRPCYQLVNEHRAPGVCIECGWVLTRSRIPSARCAGCVSSQEPTTTLLSIDSLPTPGRAEARYACARERHGHTASVRLVRVATWNVNSVKQRVPRLLPWLDQRQPDVLCLQETKLTNDAFEALLGDELATRGYACALHGEVQWNGVAILSRMGLDDVVVGVADAPGFPRPEARAVSATCGGIRVHSVYVPNGRVPDSDHYRYKLEWLAALREMIGAGQEAAMGCGDMNIAPTDADVFDPEAYVGQTHVTPAERAALADLQALGLRDVVRDRWPIERVFTYWDYRAGMFHQDLGMRIDLVLATAPVASRVRAAWVDRQARKGSGPSDHAPVIVDLDEAPDGDIGPVVPPPSMPAAKRVSVKLPQSG